MEKQEKVLLSATSVIAPMLRNSIKFRLYLLLKLPLAFLAGLRVERFDASVSEVSVPYRFLTKNPFKSTYFAALAMAAELSSGLQAMDAVQRSPRPVSMLVLHMKADFIKKARSRITFKSTEGRAIIQAVEACLQSNEGQTITVSTQGFDSSGQPVATFWFTWTFKQKQ